MLSKYIIGVAVLALLFAAASATLDCSNKPQGRYCNSPTTYDWCYNSGPSVTLQCPMGMQCLCSYIAEGNPCGPAGETIAGCEAMSSKPQQTAQSVQAETLDQRSKRSTTTCSLSTVSAAGASKKFITYFTNWAQYRPGDCAYDPAMIQGNLYTHINFGFATVDGTTFAVLPLETGDVTDGSTQGTYGKVNGLKAKYPHLKTLISLGGWSFGASIFSRMASAATSRAAFIASAIAFVRTHNFDGVDIDWEYPAHNGQGGKPEDTPNFSTLLREFRAAIESETRGNKEKLLLTIAAPAGASDFARLQLNVIHQSLDWINLMTYDFHDGSESSTGFNTPLYCHPGETLCIDYAINSYMQAGVPSSKLVLGLGTYGRSWTLSNPANTNPGASASGPGTAGKCSGETGILSYYEIAEMVANGATEKIDPVAVAAYAYSGNQWVSYDSAATIKSKIEYANAKALGGAMVWALDLDAPKGGFYELQCIAASNLFGEATTTQTEPKDDVNTNQAGPTSTTTQNVPNDDGNTNQAGPTSTTTQTEPNDGGNTNQAAPTSTTTQSGPNDDGNTNKAGPTSTTTQSGPNDDGNTNRAGPTSSTTQTGPIDDGNTNRAGPTSTTTETTINPNTTVGETNAPTGGNATAATGGATLQAQPDEPGASDRLSPTMAVIFAALTGAAVFLALSTLH